MTPERAFMLWMNDHLYMVVKRYRPEVRAHALKALKAAAVGSADAPKG